jgi:hypothetical protein
MGIYKYNMIMLHLRVKEFEKLRGGRCVEVRRFANHIVSGGAIHQNHGDYIDPSTTRPELPAPPPPPRYPDHMFLTFPTNKSLYVMLNVPQGENHHPCDALSNPATFSISANVAKDVHVSNGGTFPGVLCEFKPIHDIRMVTVTEQNNVCPEIDTRMSWGIRDKMCVLEITPHHTQTEANRRSRVTVYDTPSKLRHVGSQVIGA